MTARAWAGLLLALLAAAPAASADPEGEGPRHNPFVRPSLDAGPKAVTRARPPAPAPRPEPPPPPPEPPAPPPEPPWEPELRGTLRGGRRDVANLGGVVMAVGETLDGRRLVEVRDGEALFQGDGELFVVRRGLPTVVVPAPAEATPEYPAPGTARGGEAAPRAIESRTGGQP